MAITKKGSLYAGSTDTNGFTTGTLDITSATALIAVIGDYSGSNASTLTDLAGNTYSTPLITLVEANIRLQVWVISGPLTSAVNTWTIAGGCYGPSIGVIAWLGTATASVVDQSNNGGVTAALSTQPGSITPGQNNEVVVTMFAASNTLSSVDAPFSPADGSVTATGNHEEMGIAFEIQTTATARNPTWTMSGSGEISAGIVSLKAAATAVVVPPPPTLVRPYPFSAGGPRR